MSLKFLVTTNGFGNQIEQALVVSCTPLIPVHKRLREKGPGFDVFLIFIYE